MKTTLLLLLLPTLLFAQEFTFELETSSIPVEMEEWMPYEPFAGGLSESHPKYFDIDSDQDYDLFIGQYWGYVDYFENTGTMNSPILTLVSFSWESISCFPNNSRSNPDFFDLDNDGDSDILIGAGYVRYYRNEGTSSIPSYSGFQDTLFDVSGNWVFGTHVALLDIDSDNDGDLICGEYQGHLQLYRNIGTVDSFSFYLEDDFWLNVNVGSSGSADPTFCDIDSDNDYDLFIGERYGKIWYYRNDGDSVNYDFTYVTDNFYDIDVGNYSSPEFADIDGDGDYDLFVGKENNSAEPLGDIYFYENVGTPQNADFVLRAKNYLMVDINQFSPTPRFVDINADNALDLIAGDGTQLDYFENIGDSISAEYLFIEQGFQNISEPSISPYFVDIDADQDLDLFCGKGAIPGPPSISLYLNQGTPRTPNFQLYSSQFVTNPDFFVWIMPVLADIDADDDYDLFVFDSDDYFYFYENTGTPQWPDFTLITNQWQGIHIFPSQDTWYGFDFADLDGDLDLDLLIESPEQNNLYFYRNQGSPQVPVMILEDEQFLEEDYNYIYIPDLTDIDSDGDYDLFIGHTNGGILFFRN
ncbi:VCBS repeat-containing protein, partial [bacterium]|nr:VCBS repeat-containing protein [bacterium]